MLVKTKVRHNSYTKQWNMIAGFYHIVTKLEGGTALGRDVSVCVINFCQYK